MNHEGEKFTFFWRGHFSQWYLRAFVADGVVYNCGEQYMMAAKARLFGDATALKKIMVERDPKIQKALGRTVAGFVQSVWDAEALNIVYAGNIAKFKENPDLLQKLAATAGTTLVEASPFDRIWGIGLSENDPRSATRSTWRGTNYLGEVLTKVRKDLCGS